MVKSFHILEGITLKSRYNLPCNIAQSLNIIGDRWTLLIIHEIFVGQTTFNNIKKALDGLSSNLLSERLKYLERKKNNSVHYEEVPEVAFSRTYVCEDMSKCLCFYDAPDEIEKCRRLIFST